MTTLMISLSTLLDQEFRAAARCWAAASSTTPRQSSRAGRA